MSKFEPYLALEASAGSGKTYALCVRYITLMYLGANPSKILTLTFTNKAAAEMKARICETLKNLEKTSELESIAEQLGVSEQEVLAKKEEVLAKFLKEDLFISTIDSFFAKVLRKFALNAGFMPDFKIDTKMSEIDVLERFLRVCIKEKKYSSLLKFSINEDKKLSDMLSLLNEFYDKQSEFEPSSVSKSLHVKLDNVLNIMSNLKLLFEKEGAKDSLLKTFEAESLVDVMKKGYIQKDDLSYWQYKKHVNEEISEQFDEFKRVLLHYINDREKYILGELGELFYLYEYTLRSLNKKLSTLSFSDVTNALYTLLKDEIKKDYLYFRLDGKIEHILIDEFQDTNIIQYKILEPLMSEVVAGVGSNDFKSLFFVGDTKQSIYRFRGGAKELFRHCMEQFGVKKDVLQYNYRSSKSVVQFVNDTFKDKIKEYNSQLVKSEIDGYVEVCLDDEILKVVLEKLQFLLDFGILPKDIAILVHQNKDAKALQDFILANIPEVKVQTEANIKLINVKVVGAIIDILKYAYFKDEIYKHNFLGFLGKKWSEELDVSWLNLNATPMELIIKIVNKYEIFEDDLDVIKLVQLSQRNKDIEDFLFECDEFNDEAKKDDNDGIKILTIHKSKGLEFPHVLVVDRLGQKRGGGKTLLYEYDGINLQSIYQSVSSREFLDKSYARAKSKEKILSVDDTLNMHYVAFTRAKQTLIICAKNKDSAFNFLNLQECKFGALHVKENTQITNQNLLSMQGILRSYGQQEKFEDIKNEYDVSEQYAITFGVALHYCLELMSNFSKAALDNAFISVQNRYKMLLSDESLMDIFARVERLLLDEKFLALTENSKLHKEQPLVYKKQRKQIDLLIEKGDSYIIIDYKSSLHVQDSHMLQIGLYKKALSSISDKKIEAYLVYLTQSDIKLIRH